MACDRNQGPRPADPAGQAPARTPRRWSPVSYSSTPAPPLRMRTAAPVLGLLLFFALAAVLLLWAKWSPYLDRVHALSASHAWSGKSLLDTAGVEPGSGPSWHAATTFT